jgi:hypothetical protein
MLLIRHIMRNLEIRLAVGLRAVDVYFITRASEQQTAL